MREDKQKAIKLRKDGNSYNQISQLLKIPKSTLSYWFSDLEISQKAKNKILERVGKTSIALLVKRNKNQTVLARERALEIRYEAKKESYKLLKDPLFLVGVSLYWAEGYKKGASGSKWKSFDFANSDPEMVRVMMKFIRKFLKSDDKRIKIQLLAHRNININETVNFWSKLTKIPKGQFIKTYNTVNKTSKNKRRGDSLTRGTVHIRINDVKLFFRSIGWIDGLKEKFNK